MKQHKILLNNVQIKRREDKAAAVSLTQYRSTNTVISLLRYIKDKPNNRRQQRQGTVQTTEYLYGSNHHSTMFLA